MNEKKRESEKERDRDSQKRKRGEVERGLKGIKKLEGDRLAEDIQYMHSSLPCRREVPAGMDSGMLSRL